MCLPTLNCTLKTDVEHVAGVSGQLYLAVLSQVLLHQEETLKSRVKKLMSFVQKSSDHPTFLLAANLDKVKPTVKKNLLNVHSLYLQWYVCVRPW